jgi:alkylhydroperoxidase family enzyme
VDINSAVGREAGLTDEKLLAVRGEDSSTFNDTERAVIELADALTSTPADVNDELYARLRQQFSEEQLLELSAHIAFENFRARLNRLYQAESDGLYVPGAKGESRAA